MKRILILLVAAILLAACSPSATQTKAPVQVSQAGGCSASDIKKAVNFYSDQVKKIGAITQTMKSGVVTQSAVDKANKIAYDTIDFDYPICAMSAHEHFEKYATMIAVSVKFAYDKKYTEATTALDSAMSAFNKYVAEIEKLK